VIFNFRFQPKTLKSLSRYKIERKKFILESEIETGDQPLQQVKFQIHSKHHKEVSSKKFFNKFSQKIKLNKFNEF
jgi:hypothetical protein